MKIGNNIEPLQSELVARAANREPFAPVASSSQQVGGVDSVDRVELSKPRAVSPPTPPPASMATSAPTR